MLPDLMSCRGKNREAGSAGGQPAAVLVAPTRPEPSAKKLAEWAQLTAHQRTPRRSTR
jgi:hypothetical protein